MPPGQRSLFRTDHYVSLPRRPRRSFVRRAAVMQVMPESARAAAARAMAPGSTSGSGEEAGDGEDEVGGLAGGDAPGSATDNDAVDLAADTVREGGSQGVAQARESANPRKRSAREEAGDVRDSFRAPRARAAGASDALAEELASRSRNPRIFPATHWMPGAHAVLSAAQVPRAVARNPPMAPPLSGGATPVGAGVASLPQRFSTPLLSPLPPLQPPPPPPRRAAPVGETLPAPPPRAAPVGETLPPASPLLLDDGDSSSDMNDDDLVAAYITPPVLPSARSPMSPRSTRPSSGKRRLSSSACAACTARVAATASAAVAAPGAGDDGPALTLQDVRDSIRNGLSSVRREMTRFRAEMVVVKSQAASALRRMDGLAAVADGSQSSNGAVLERLAGLETTLNGFGRRLPSVHAGAEHGASAEAATVRTINEIKVSERATLLLAFSLRGENRGARLRPTVCHLVFGTMTTSTPAVHACLAA